jgi:hypothetical protein
MWQLTRLCRPSVPRNRQSASAAKGRALSKQLLSFALAVSALLMVSVWSCEGLAYKKPRRAPHAGTNRPSRSSNHEMPDPPGRAPPVVVVAPAPLRDSAATSAPRAAERASFTTALGVVFLGLDLGGRQYHYNQRITNATLRPYDLPDGALLPVAPGVAASAELYPLAGSDAGVGRDIGVVFDWRYDFVSTNIGNVSVATRWSSWAAGLRARLHTGRRGSSPVIGVEAGTGALLFDFRDAGPLGPIMPSVDYRYLYLGTDVRFPLGLLALTAGVGYRGLLTTTGASGENVPAAGALGEHFPHADIRGIHAKTGAALAITKAIEARIVIHYVRFWATFHPDVGATYVAGGALDQFVNTDIGLGAHF